jgi:hypothetical protein
MALTWELGGITNWRETCHTPFIGGGDERKLSPITEAMIWHCMFVGMGEITEKNWLEWWMRYHTLNSLFEEVETYPHVVDGKWVVDGHGQLMRRPMLASDVRAHVGLKTNCFPNWSKTRFYHRLMQAAADHANVPRAEQPTLPPMRRG